MLKKILFHILGALLILAGWALCVTAVGLDRGAVAFYYFTKTNILGLVLIFSGAYLPEIATFLIDRKS